MQRPYTLKAQKSHEKLQYLGYLRRIVGHTMNIWILLLGLLTWYLKKMKSIIENKNYNLKNSYGNQ